jgi:hypothetical protein
MYGANNMKKAVVFSGQFPPILGGHFELESGGQFTPKLMVNLHWNGVVNLTVFSNKGCTGYLFIGNRSRNYINLIFQIDGSEILDMGECCDFMPINKVQSLDQRIYIHSFNDRKSEEFIPL